MSQSLPENVTRELSDADLPLGLVELSDQQLNLVAGGMGPTGGWGSTDVAAGPTGGW